MGRTYIYADEKVYLHWLYDDDLFQMLDESRPLRERAHELTKEVSMFCDGARAKDCRGFNRLDTTIGKAIARDTNMIYTLSPEQFRRWCIKLLRYRSQVRGRFLHRLFEGEA